MVGLGRKGPEPLNNKRSTVTLVKNGLISKILTGAVVTALFVLTAVSLQAEAFKIDPVHSKVMFKVRHLGISTVTGQFNKFSGSFTFDPAEPENAHVSARIEAASVDTGVEARDKDLRSANFFEVAKFPELSFSSTRIEPGENGHFKLTGNLTLHGVTRAVTLDAILGGIITDPWGKKRAAFTVDGTINRKDFGLTWNRVLETGGLVVANQVEIILEIEATHDEGASH